MSFPSHHLYYDDLEISAHWTSQGRTLTEADIINFAGLSGDFNPIHIDHEFAKASPFRKPIAHGLAVFSIASGLTLAAPPCRILAMLEVNHWMFTAPVFIGDTIRIRSTVKSKTIRGVGKRGEVLWLREILNQDDKTVQSGEMKTLVECRPIQASHSA